MGLFRGGAKRALTLGLDVLLSMFSLLIHYCATRVALWLGFFLRKQKPFLWAVRTRSLMRRAGLEGAAAFGLRAQLLRGPCLLWVRVWRSWLCRQNGCPLCLCWRIAVKRPRGISPKQLSWIGVEALCFQGCCCVLPMSHDVSAESADSQYLHNQANGGKNAHHHNGEA